MNEVLVVPIKEVLTPFTGRQLLEDLIGKFKVKLDDPDMMQLIVLSPQQFQLINQRAAAADYFITTVQKAVVGLEAYDSRNEGEKLTKLINQLHDFVMNGEEPGDEPPKN